VIFLNIGITETITDTNSLFTFTIIAVNYIVRL